MTNLEVVARKLSVLAEFSRRARRRRPPSAEALVQDTELLDALSMALLVCIQEAIDIAFHIVVDERWGTPNSYGESFALLVQNGVLSPELGAAMSSAVGLRNRLAHGYAGVDAARLWAELPRGLDALDEYAQKIAGFLSK